MNETLHFQLLACHTLFQRTFLRKINAFYPYLLPGQPKVIEYLMQCESAYQREIADGCLVEPSTLCLILEKMEKAGLLQRKKMPENKKNSIVSLTAKGREAGKKIKEVFIETEALFCNGLSTAEREALGRLLKKVYVNGKAKFN